MTKEQAHEKITELVSIFEEQHESYHRSAYDEAKTRGDFINKFFRALGWDVDNDEGYAEAYREVIPEDKLKIGGNMKAPDYAFTVGGTRKFFVEAKKPSVQIKTDKLPAYQLRRYGWNARMPVSVLTNFEELSIYDCTKRPNVNDSAGIARIKYIGFRDYVKEFDFIWDTFSKEAVLKGRFDKFVQTDTQKRGTATVDKAFLESLDEWRKYLATSVARNNHKFGDDELNYVVQQTLDRIIFLRFCEDRSVEPYGSLKDTLKQGDYYKKLFKLFKEADRKYNSGLFDFKKDQLSEKTVLDDKVIKNIIEELYYPKCDYDFSVMPVEILGNAYEQFLGKVIRVTPGHIVKIEEKPEVRKAGGVYYTPQYIVDYIVQNTVGKLVEGKTPAEIEKLKIVDPACGSGSFLLGAFQYLLHYHTKYYLEKGLLGSKKKDNPLTPDGRLTTAEKRRIITNNIFGVDIDTQAVEVTKLSMLLKAMEGETPASITHQLTIGHERVLPNLDNNIKCGNSLIGPDFYDSQLNLEPEAEKKINVFDWKKGFPKVFEQGGFDVVIGNPPYVDSRVNEIITKDYWKTHYASSQFGKTNTYEIFIEKGLKVLKTDGKLGFIIPVVLLNLEACKGLRELLIKNYCIDEIAYGDFAVFEDANVDTMVILLSQRTKSKNKEIEIRKFSEKFAGIIEEHSFETKDANEINDYKITLKSNDLIKSLSSQKIKYLKISQVVDFYNGIATGPDKEKYFSYKKVNNKYKPLLMGNNIGYYSLGYVEDIFFMKERNFIDQEKKKYFSLMKKL